MKIEGTSISNNRIKFVVDVCMVSLLVLVCYLRQNASFLVHLDKAERQRSFCWQTRLHHSKRPVPLGREVSFSSKSDKKWKVL